jgi:hypothetical protein
MKNDKVTYRYDAQADYETLVECIESINASEEALSSLIFIGDNNQLTVSEINQALSKLKKPMLGGIFTGLISEGQNYDHGILRVDLPYALKTATFDLSNARNMNDHVLSFYEKIESHGKTMFLFVDAFADNKMAFINEIYNYFGISVSYLGGGAGSLSFDRKPVVFNETGILENAAVIGMLDESVQVGVSHGWTPISNPLKVTEAEGKLVKSIDWEPAFDVYKKLIQEHANIEISKENFFDVAKSYPFGMSKIQANFVVRDPISVQDNGLLIVDEIPSGEFVYVLHGNKKQLLQGASDARNKGVVDSKSTIFCIDCISRVLYLADDFKDEIRTIDNGGMVYGILSLGEIANFGTNLEIFNKTIVVTQL